MSQDYREENQCECDVEPGEFCENEVTQVVEEPYTPGRFTIRCCAECADGLVSFGYHRVKAVAA